MKLRKSDILLILGLLLAAGLMWFFLRPGEVGTFVTISQESGEVLTFPLYENRSITLSNHDQGYNVLVIENGNVYISDANCGDHTCIRTGAISREGEQIICLPHKLVVEITGGVSSEIDGSTH